MPSRLQQIMKGLGMVPSDRMPSYFTVPLSTCYHPIPLPDRMHRDFVCVISMECDMATRTSEKPARSVDQRASGVLEA